jgi:hypothetical protein
MVSFFYPLEQMKVQRLRDLAFRQLVRAGLSNRQRGGVNSQQIQRSE